MSYYIKGDSNRGAEVIKTLEEKGGKNRFNFDGEKEHVLYYIDKSGTINIEHENSIDLIESLCEKLTLPEWEPKFKVGDYVRIKESGICGKISKINYDTQVYSVYYPDLKYENTYLEEAIIKWEPKRGETVLVRDSNIVRWKEAIFSFQVDNLYYVLGGNSWVYCIPFDIDNLGKA